MQFLELALEERETYLHNHLAATEVMMRFWIEFEDGCCHSKHEILRFLIKQFKPPILAQ